MTSRPTGRVLALGHGWRDYRIYDGIAVHPYTRLLSRPDGQPGMIGGPAYPDFDSLTWERHNRYGRADDTTPAAAGDPSARLEGTWWWCGPIVDDFAHEFAEFSHRLPLGDVAPDVGLVFSASPSGSGGVLVEPPPFVADALAHLGLDGRPLAVIAEPARVERLIVAPQGAQMRWHPHPEYLAELEPLQAAAFGGDSRIDALFISRAGQSRGRLMGEGYLEELLLACGVHILHGESVRFSALLRMAASARRLLVTEGGACQGLGMLGTLDADVTMLARRAPEAFTREECAIPLRSRARGEFTIVDSASEFVSLGVPGQERDDPNSMALVEPELLISGLAELGFDVSARFRMEDFLSAVDNDLVAYQSSFFAKVMARQPDFDERQARVREAVSQWREALVDRDRAASRHPDEQVPSGAAPVHILAGVWDNVDLLEGWLRHHRGMGVQGVVAMDYGSTDGSAELLTSPEWADFVTLVPFTGLDTDTNLAMLQFARAVELPGWLLMIDPDEYLVTPSGRIDDISIVRAMEDSDLVTLPRFHMTAPRSLAETEPFPGVQAATLREVEQDQGKVLVRVASDASTDMSGHSGVARRAAQVEGVSTCLLHVPVRSFLKFAEKVGHAEVTLAADPSLPDWFAHHWRRWVQMKQAGTLREEYLDHFVHDDAVDALIASGVLVSDERLRGIAGA
jgi:hypothetical protein